MNFDFGSIESIRAAGFEGFLSIKELQATNCEAVPRERGIYLILRMPLHAPTFLASSVGGHFKKRNPTVELAVLESAWVADTPVVYIGKAGGSRSKATLYTRLRSYMQFGKGKPVGHWGGRYIWQLADGLELVVCWQATPDAELAEVESRLIREFKQQYQQRPFANLRN